MVHVIAVLLVSSFYVRWVKVIVVWWTQYLQNRPDMDTPDTLSFAGSVLVLSVHNLFLSLSLSRPYHLLPTIILK